MEVEGGTQYPAYFPMITVKSGKKIGQYSRKTVVVDGTIPLETSSNK